MSGSLEAEAHQAGEPWNNALLLEDTLPSPIRVDHNTTNQQEAKHHSLPRPTQPQRGLLPVPPRAILEANLVRTRLEHGKSLINCP